MPSLGIRLQPELQAVGFQRKDLSHCSVPTKSPWLLKRPQIDFSIYASCKYSTSPEIFCAKYYEICDLYQDFCKLYTDGSVIVIRLNQQPSVVPPQKPFDFLMVLVFSEQHYMLSLWHSTLFTARRKVNSSYFLTLCLAFKL